MYHTFLCIMLLALMANYNRARARWWHLVEYLRWWMVVVHSMQWGL